MNARSSLQLAAQLLVGMGLSTLVLLRLLFDMEHLVLPPRFAQSVLAMSGAGILAYLTARVVKQRFVYAIVALICSATSAITSLTLTRTFALNVRRMGNEGDVYNALLDVNRLHAFLVFAVIGSTLVSAVVFLIVAAKALKREKPADPGAAKAQPTQSAG